MVSENGLWWNGAAWLSKKEEWPADITTSASPESKTEEKVLREVFTWTRVINDVMDALLKKFSYGKLLRVSAWVATFLRNVRKQKGDRLLGPLSTTEIEKQESFWVKRTQQDSQASVNFERDSLQLNVQPNEEGVLECRGRIQGQYPIYLPDAHPFSTKIVTEAHLRSLHGGIGMTMTRVREQYWIPRLRRLARKIIKSCNACYRFQAKAYEVPPPGKLPIDRTEVSGVFEVVGVDFAGPIRYRKSKKQEGKAYLVVYACSLTQALYLEVLESMETAEFLQSLKRLIARRGHPRKIYSDNGRTFVAASKWMRAVMKDESTNAFLSKEGIKWQFKLSHAPWWGGQFKRLIGLIKQSLHKTIGNSFLSLVELREVVLDVEVALNNQPLSYVEDDVQLPILTPNSFLYGCSNPLLEIDPHRIETKDLRKRAKHLKRCKEAVWRRWTGEYLHGLRERHNMNHLGKQRKPAVGEIVIVKSEEKSRGKWKMGKVVQVIKGTDDIVRGAKVRVGTTEIERPVQHLFPLELSCDVGKKGESIMLSANSPEFRPRSKHQAAVEAKNRIAAIGTEEED